jgi:hypothetical protein
MPLITLRVCRDRLDDAEVELDCYAKLDVKWRQALGETLALNAWASARRTTQGLAAAHPLSPAGATESAQSRGTVGADPCCVVTARSSRCVRA